MSRLSERLEEERGITFAEFKEKMTFENNFVQDSYFAHEAGRRSQNCLDKLQFAPSRGIYLQLKTFSYNFTVKILFKKKLMQHYRRFSLFFRLLEFKSKNNYFTLTCFCHSKRFHGYEEREKKSFIVALRFH
jgi:hypothetical protein